MKKQRPLLFTVCVVAFATVALFAQLPPQTLPPALPSKPEKLPMLKNPAELPQPPMSGTINRTEVRAFRVAGQDYRAVLLLRDINASPEWSPSSALPLSLGEVEAAARVELNKLVTDAPEWEITSMQLNRLPQEGTGKRWYYVVTFKPMLQPGGVAPLGDILVMLTIDGKPGRISKL